MFDFKKEILDHAAREIDAAVADQAANDEVTVPAVHFIEAAAGNHVAIFEIEKSGRIERVGVHFAGMMDDGGQVFNFELAGFLKIFQGGGLRKIGGEIHYGGGRQLGVHDGAALVHRTGERVPAGGNIGANGGEAGGIFCSDS